MTWGEAIRLTQVLIAAPDSQIGAAMQGWEFPISRETAAVLDLFDLEHAKAAKSPRPHSGRPWTHGKRSGSRRIGNVAGRTREEVRRILNAHGHNL